MQSKPVKQKTSKASKGSVQVKVSNNRLQLVFSHPIITPTGEVERKRFYISTGFDDTTIGRQQAQVLAAKVQRDIDYGELDLTLAKYKSGTSQNVVTPISTPKVQINELWHSYTEFKKTQNIAETTLIRDYGKIEKRIRDFPHQSVEDAVLIRDYLLTVTKPDGSRRYSPDTAKRTLKRLSECCDWAIGSGYIAANPFKKLAKEIRTNKRTLQTRKAFTKQGRDSIIRALESDVYSSKFSPHRHSYYAPFVRFLFFTGTRPEEAIALKWKHIKDNQITIAEAVATDVRIRKDCKTHTVRFFPINSQLKAILDTVRPENPNPESLVFPAKNNREINTHNFLNRIWKPIVEKLVEKGEVKEYLPLYNCRHTFITLMRQAGYSPEYIAALVGNSPEMIMRNYSAEPEHLEVPEL